jgi:membrane-associated phospholipid phosphatase
LDRQTEMAQIFSKVFTPFGVAAIISIVFSLFSPTAIGSLMSALSSALVGFLTLCVVPFLPVADRACTGRSDLEVPDARKRVPLYALGLTGYALGIAAFLILNNRLMFVMSLAYLCVGTAACVITLVWKISAHTAGIAGPTTALVFVFGYWVIPLFVLSVFMVWARLKLRAHTLGQAVGGLVVAIPLTSIVYLVFHL